MAALLTDLLERNPKEVKALLNVLVESPYFYRADNEDLFFFLRRHRTEFTRFYEQFYGWVLLMDGKCARVYKDRWYNDAITEANRDLFRFRRRDECLGFMLLLEFFEHRLEENSMTVEDRDNLRFRFGDLLTYTARRLRELFAADGMDARYTDDYTRSEVLRRILPTLERYRFVTRIRPPDDMTVAEQDMIFEALPALYHYNATGLSQSIAVTAGRTNQENTDTEEEPARVPE